MNFPTAEKYSKAEGYLFGRSVWVDGDGNATKWLVWEQGAFYVYTASTRSIVENDTLSEADYRAVDYRFPDGCGDVAVLAEPDIPGSSQASAPTFDVANPPCKIQPNS